MRDIITNFPNSTERKLISSIRRTKKKEVIYVSRLPRQGFSGASLLLAYFSTRPEGCPFIIKVAKRDDIRRESKAVQSMEGLVTDSHMRIDRPAYADDWGALLYDHAGSIDPHRASDPRTLREILYSKKPHDSIRQLKSTLQSVYSTLREAHSKQKTINVNIQRHYRRYFRANASAAIIKCVLGSNATSEQFEFLGQHIINPVSFRNDLPAQRRVCTGRVHGDLHPDNVILHASGVPHLIDFAWAEGNRDVLVDYVLMENSLRFMHFPKYINLDEQARIDSALLREDGWSDIPGFNFSNDMSKFYFIRLASMIHGIRESARNALGTRFSMDDYLFTQFIVLYGLLRFDSYNPYVGTRALGMMARRLA